MQVLTIGIGDCGSLVVPPAQSERNLGGGGGEGASIFDDNFADEERTSVEVLVRQTLQNPLDTRSRDSVVRVEYRLVTVGVATSEFR
ncbi:hypothetical protein BK659_19700 [Pseudomonas brassicacearum]|uniref:Uncharacterized protein n=1 Tax=Pseudomonas brassicacearum TaxID=930166 RepID=A0A423H2S1_9PSED|nr:hypothetical protein BK659_19700 [Pseudomonas brassicacearum]